jgi:hypothetical protein
MNRTKMLAAAGIAAMTASLFVEPTAVIAQTAAPKMIYLMCGASYRVTIDLVAKTANNKPAQINPAAIDWEAQHDLNPNPETQAVIANAHLDRVTGVLTQSYQFIYSPGASGGQLPPQDFPCVPTAPPVGKF